MSTKDDKSERNETRGSPDAGDRAGSRRGHHVRAFIGCVLLILGGGVLVIGEISTGASTIRFGREAVHWLRHFLAGPGRPYAFVISLGFCAVGALLISTHIHFRRRVRLPKHWLPGGGAVAMLMAVLVAAFGRLPSARGPALPEITGQVPQEATPGFSEDSGEPGGAGSSGSTNQAGGGQAPGVRTTPIGTSAGPRALAASTGSISPHDAIYEPHEIPMEETPEGEDEPEGGETPGYEEDSSNETAERSSASTPATATSTSSSVTSTSSATASSSATATSSSLTTTTETTEPSETEAPEEESECE